MKKLLLLTILIIVCCATIVTAFEKQQSLKEESLPVPQTGLGHAIGEVLPLEVGLPVYLCPTERQDWLLNAYSARKILKYPDLKPIATTDENGKWVALNVKPGHYCAFHFDPNGDQSISVSKSNFYEIKAGEVTKFPAQEPPPKNQKSEKAAHNAGEYKSDDDKWSKISTKDNNPYINLMFKVAGNGGPRLEVTPQQKGVAALSVTKAKGPEDSDGKIYVKTRGDILAVDSEKPITLQYLKEKLELQKGYYAIRFKDNSNWVVIEIEQFL